MEIRSYTNNDEYAIIELFKICFKKDVTDEFWNWRFNQNPFTDDKFIHLMWDGPLLVGHYAVSPIEMIINGEKKMTALSMTTMTHPKYGGKGIFSDLAKNVYETLKKSNYEMVWGFPNSKSHYGFVKNLKWSDLATIGMMKLDMVNFVFTDNLNGIKYFDDYSLISNNTIISKSIRINKNINYLNWRFKNNPSFEYKFIASSEGNFGMIYKLFQSFSELNQFDIDILDVYNCGIEEIRALISYIVKEEDLRIKNINIWSNFHDERQVHLEKLGFVLKCPITYMGLKPFKPNSIILDYSQWDINFANSDVF